MSNDMHTLLNLIVFAGCILAVIYLVRESRKPLTHVLKVVYPEAPQMPRACDGAAEHASATTDAGETTQFQRDAFDSMITSIEAAADAAPNKAIATRALALVEADRDDVLDNIDEFRSALDDLYVSPQGHDDIQHARYQACVESADTYAEAIALSQRWEPLDDDGEDEQEEVTAS